MPGYSDTGLHAHTLRPRECKCHWPVTQTQSHMGSEHAKKGGGGGNGRTDISFLLWRTQCPTVNLWICSAHYFTTLCISKILFSAWLSPYYSIPHCWMLLIGSPHWITCYGLPIGCGSNCFSPIPVGLSRNGKWNISESGMRYFIQSLQKSKYKPLKIHPEI